MKPAQNSVSQYEFDTDKTGEQNEKEQNFDFVLLFILM